MCTNEKVNEFPDGTPRTTKKTISNADIVFLFLFSTLTSYLAWIWKDSSMWSFHIAIALLVMLFFVTRVQDRKMFLCSHKFTKKLFQYFADLGKRLWNFESLWFVVLIVGFYTAGISGVEEYQNKYSNPNFDPSLLLLKVLKEMVIVGFLAVVTSILAQAFAGNSRQSERLTRLESRIEHFADKFGVISKNLDKQAVRMTKAISMADNAVLAFKSLGKSLAIGGAIGDIFNSTRNICKENENLIKFTSTVEKMSDNLTGFFLLALSPILPHSNQFRPEDPESLARGLGEMTNSAHQPHFAYMSAAISRNFYSESLERHFPGVLINLTSFSCYIQTVKAVIESLEPWGGRFEFYTLMPDSPLQLFKFQNSTDFSEWIDFLSFYCDCATQGKSKWKRYFGIYKDNPIQGFNHDEVVKKWLKNGIVLTDKSTLWKPLRVQETRLSEYLSGINPANIESFERENKFHNGYASLVMSDKSWFLGEVPQGTNWQWTPLQDAILRYHSCSDITSSDDRQKAEMNFCFRYIDQFSNIFKNETLDITSRNTVPTGNPITRTVRVPKDIFAIRDLSDSENPQWLFFIGRENSHNEDMESAGRVAITTIVDFPTLNTSSTETNKNMKNRLKAWLDEIFLPQKEGDLNSLSQFLDAGGI